MRESLKEETRAGHKKQNIKHFASMRESLKKETRAGHNLLNKKQKKTWNSKIIIAV